MKKVALITGANSGLGFAVARRLLEEDKTNALHLCLLCRNALSAEKARDTLLSSFPLASIDLLAVDTSRPHSVISACEEITTRYSHIDLIFLNAGVMPVAGMKLSRLWPLTPSHMKKILITGTAILHQKDDVTPEGLQKTFATNVFGHFLMVRQLEEKLSNQNQPCHVIWSSSQASLHNNINLNDIQDAAGRDPYGVSKKTIDLTAIQLNKELSEKGIHCHAASPGLFVSQMTQQMLPWCVWYLLLPILMLIRLLFTATITFTPYAAAESLVWLSRQDPSILEHEVQYHSLCTALGRPYVGHVKVSGTEDGPELVQHLDNLAKRFTEIK